MMLAQADQTNGSMTWLFFALPYRMAAELSSFSQRNGMSDQQLDEQEGHEPFEARRGPKSIEREAEGNHIECRRHRTTKGRGRKEDKDGGGN